MSYCACGKPLHYTDRKTRVMVERLVAESGEEVVVHYGQRCWLVQRHYVALHGLKPAALPTLPFIEVVNDEVIIPYLHDSGHHRRKINVHDFNDQVFEHIDPDDGLVRNFHINKLLSLINKHPEVCELDDTEVDPAIIDFLMANRGLDTGYIDQLVTTGLPDTPGIVCQFNDGSFLTVDGNHRLVARHRRGETTMKFWFVPERIWRKSLLAPVYQR